MDGGTRGSETRTLSSLYPTSGGNITVPHSWKVENDSSTLTNLEREGSCGRHKKRLRESLCSLMSVLEQWFSTSGSPPLWGVEFPLQKGHLRPLKKYLQFMTAASLQL